MNHQRIKNMLDVFMPKKLLVLSLILAFILEANFVVAYHGGVGGPKSLTTMLLIIVGMVIAGAVLTYYLRKISMETGKKK